MPGEMEMRFAKLMFTLCFPEGGQVPERKESALRGGLGNMLLAQNCVRDRDCPSCSFREDCLAQRIMYAPYRIRPSYVTRESMGFMLFCPDRRTRLLPGDEVRFSLTLFGPPIAYFAPLLHALYAFGKKGLGVREARFFISKIENRAGEAILDGEVIRMDRYRVETAADYAREREEDFPEDPARVRLHFLSPLSVKYQSQFINRFDRDTAAGVVNAICRKVHMLMLFEGVSAAEPVFAPDVDYIYLGGHTVREQSERYSSTAGGKTPLRGISGWMELEVKNRELMRVLAAGELASPGKNTRFGFGVYRMERGGLRCGS